MRNFSYNFKLIGRIRGLVWRLRVLVVSIGGWGRGLRVWVEGRGFELGLGAEVGD